MLQLSSLALSHDQMVEAMRDYLNAKVFQETIHVLSVEANGSNTVFTVTLGPALEGDK